MASYVARQQSWPRNMAWLWRFTGPGSRKRALISGPESDPKRNCTSSISVTIQTSSAAVTPAANNTLSNQTNSAMDQLIQQMKDLSLGSTGSRPAVTPAANNTSSKQTDGAMDQLIQQMKDLALGSAGSTAVVKPAVNHVSTQTDSTLDQLTRQMNDLSLGSAGITAVVRPAVNHVSTQTDSAMDQLIQQMNDLALGSTGSPSTPPSSPGSSQAHAPDRAVKRKRKDDLLSSTVKRAASATHLIRPNRLQWARLQSQPQKSPPVAAKRGNVTSRCSTATNVRSRCSTATNMSRSLWSGAGRARRR
ncbi:uncharacterized protein LOC144023855 [Festucalex cinctus]